MPVVMNQMMNQEMEQLEIEQMHMLGQRRHGPMEHAGRMNSFEDQRYRPGRGGMGNRGGMMDGGGHVMRGAGGGMMDGGRRPSGARNSIMDLDAGVDMDYMEYTDDLQNMAVAMDNRFKGGRSNPMFERRGDMQRGGVMNRGRGGGGVQSRLGNRGSPARGKSNFPPPPALGLILHKAGQKNMCAYIRNNEPQ